ncbi:chemotaxis response regulator protein-glutamate methylesterase [Chitinimonas prasina]|uniref:protein-glutamate methylesterase n=1 Tax=Chitinimonas prasina TaxID=1434937 RepID=A0ABQ5YAV1_9NEIS|nr:chemotaxis protein CheB [Chitinimonas prasina]GLR11681.1 chemotaxis response regulator protein-glutamate methylesterase [Chitinimonas prasina]
MHVLLVDDSSVSRQLLRHILEQVGFRVSEAEHGQAALDHLAALQPDLITMDVHMPGLDGFETTRRIMQQHPMPIVIVTSGINLPGAQTAMQALEAGALMVLEKPSGPTDPHFQQRAEVLASSLLYLAQAVVKQPGPSDDTQASSLLSLQHWLQRPFQALVMGASAGGPPAIKTLLNRLSPACPWPILLVQHISPGFSGNYCEWLATQTTMPVQLASHGQVALPGQIYVAPDDQHLRVDASLQLSLDQSARQPFIRPAIDELFDSAASQMRGHTIAVLLSGMGRDGVDGLSRLKALGALTLVQSPASSVVDGMPKAAINQHAACYVETPGGVATILNRLMHHT